MAVERLPKKPQTRLSWNIFKRVLGRWHFWMFSSLWAITGEVESFSSNNLFGLYLQDMGRPIGVRNNYPMGVAAVGIVTTITAVSCYENTYTRLGGKSELIRQ